MLTVTFETLQLPGNVVPENISSAASMLKEQHMPLSVGKVVKRAEHGMVIPFQEQN